MCSYYFIFLTYVTAPSNATSTQIELVKGELFDSGVELKYPSCLPADVLEVDISTIISENIDGYISGCPSSVKNTY